MAPLTRICLTGPESTGKTGIAQRLARELGTVWVPEYAREYVSAVARELTADDVEPIARGQIDGENRLTARASRVLVLDTDLISTVVYARHYYGACPKWIEEEARRRRADLYLLMNIDLPWAPDPARDAEHVRKELFGKFERALREFGADYRIVSGTFDERLRSALRYARPA